MSAAVEVPEGAVGSAGRATLDFVLLPPNGACRSDESFELIQGGAFLTFTGARFGSAIIDEIPGTRLFYQPETAVICLTGDPARPTIAWNPDYLARRAADTPPIVDTIAVDEIFRDETGFETHPGLLPRPGGAMW